MPDKKPMDKPGRGIIRVAVVDDDKALLSVFSALMKHAEYHTHFFSKPQRALDEITAVKGHYHLVITDFNMPDMNGIHFAKRLRTAEPQLPIILMSGELLSEEVRAQTALMGRIAILEKPFGLNTVLDDFIPKFLRGEA